MELMLIGGVLEGYFLETGLLMQKTRKYQKKII